MRFVYTNTGIVFLVIFVLYFILIRLFAQNNYCAL